MPRRKKRKAHRNGSRPLVLDTVRARSVGARDYDVVAFTFSKDVIDKLFELYDMDYALINPTFGRDRHKKHRMQFVRCADMGMPLVMVRIEPPSFDPRGQRFHQGTHSRQYITTIKARRIGVANGIVSKKLEHYWADLPGRNQLRGLILVFPDDDMLLTPEARTRAWDGKIKPTFDLLA